MGEDGSGRQRSCIQNGGGEACCRTACGLTRANWGQCPHRWVGSASVPGNHWPLACVARVCHSSSTHHANLLVLLRKRGEGRGGLGKLAEGAGQVEGEVCPEGADGREQQAGARPGLAGNRSQTACTGVEMAADTSVASTEPNTSGAVVVWISSSMAWGGGGWPTRPGQNPRQLMSSMV